MSVRNRWFLVHALLGVTQLLGCTLLVVAALLRQPAHDDPALTLPRHLEATVYLPLADNDGRPFSEAVWYEALAALVTPFGGATLGEPREGCWVDARGHLHRERVRPVVVSFDQQRLVTFRQTVEEVRKKLGQECMYVRYEQPHVELIPSGGAQ